MLNSNTNPSARTWIPLFVARSKRYPPAQVLMDSPSNFLTRRLVGAASKVPLKQSKAVLKVNLLAEREQNVFNIELWDATGGKQSVVPNSLTYTVGLAISEQPIINSIAVELVGNVADVFFKKGDPLPAKSTKVYLFCDRQKR